LIILIILLLFRFSYSKSSSKIWCFIKIFKRFKAIYFNELSFIF
jgi:hypothetical protein